MATSTTIDFSPLTTPLSDDAVKAWKAQAKASGASWASFSAANIVALVLVVPFALVFLFVALGIGSVFVNVAANAQNPVFAIFPLVIVLAVIALIAFAIVKGVGAFGRRWELDRIGINLSFLNFILYQDADEFDGTSVGWIELGADYFVDPYASSTAYFGAGLSIGTHSIPSDRDRYENAGLQGKVSVGYELFRASNIRLLLHADATLPMFRLSSTNTDPVTLIETEDHVYAPTFQLCLGLGWGTLSN